jgi:hypothetical protein
LLLGNNVAGLQFVNEIVSLMETMTGWDLASLLEDQDVNEVSFNRSMERVCGYALSLAAVPCAV